MRCMPRFRHTNANYNTLFMYAVVQSADADADALGSDGDAEECFIEGDEVLDDGSEEGHCFEMAVVGDRAKEVRRKGKGGSRKKGKKKPDKNIHVHRSERMRQQVLGLLQNRRVITSRL